MTTSKTAVRRHHGFTLIELLTVIAIIGILAAILIPTVGKVRKTAQRTADASNIRQIVSACQIYANDFNGRLPGTKQTSLDNTGPGVGSALSDGSGDEADEVDVHVFAAALARNGGLNDANLWVSPQDEAALATNLPLTNVLTSTAPTSDYATNFSTAIISYMAVSGLTTNRPSTTPVLFTRGLKSDGTWSASTTTTAGGVYGEDGGHIAFLGGNVQFYQNLTTSKLAAYDGTPTSDILKTLTTTEGIVTQTGASLSSSPGTGNAPP